MKITGLLPAYFGQSERFHIYKVGGQFWWRADKLVAGATAKASTSQINADAILERCLPQRKTKRPCIHITLIESGDFMDPDEAGPQRASTAIIQNMTGLVSL